jgi:hypothetical protein
MPRVVPSQVVKFIATISQGKQGPVRMNSLGRPALSSILAMTERVPDELLTMNAEAYGLFVYAQEQLKEILTVWSANETAGQKLKEFSFDAFKNPLIRLSAALAECPDEAPQPGTSELKFIADADLRADLRNDIGRINRALADGEWKAATLIAGSVVEALLLWALEQRRQADITNAITALIANRVLTKQPHQDLNRWDLHEYIEVAANLSIIKPETALQMRLTKDFRNLIHPGRAQRLAQKCDRATALSAVAGVEHAVRDLG